jgi:hypothetical protein
MRNSPRAQGTNPRAEGTDPRAQGTNPRADGNKPPEYPKVSPCGHYLVLQDGRDYEIPDNPIEVLGLLHHFTGKAWCSTQWLRAAIDRIATIRRWQVYGGGTVWPLGEWPSKESIESLSRKLHGL